MPREAILPSPALARFLREQRLNLGLTLHEVQDRTNQAGLGISPSVIARIEEGQVEPGIPRTQVLFKAYGLPLSLLADLMECDEVGELPPPRLDATTLLERALLLFDSGNRGGALAHLLALRLSREGETREAHALRLRAVVVLAVAFQRSGNLSLSKRVLDDVITNPPADETLLREALIALGECWWLMGSAEMGLALLDRAAAHTGGATEQDLRTLQLSRINALLAAGDLAEAERVATITADETKMHDEVEIALMHGIAWLAATRAGRTPSWRRTSSHLAQAVLTATRARAALDACDLDSAVALSKKAVAEADLVDDPRVGLMAYGTLWCVAVQASQPKVAKAALKKLRAWLDDTDDLTETIILLRRALAAEVPTPKQSTRAPRAQRETRKRRS
ncbi:MAG: helix-turn-helix transcriptional regulator [Acidobacteriota bacterium]